MPSPLGASNERVVVVGPVIIDNYFLGTVTRLDQTAAVPIVDVVQGDRAHIYFNKGGGANAAENLAHMAMPVAFVSVVGIDSGGQAFRKIAPTEMVNQDYVITDPHYQTPQKNRIFAGGRLVARFDFDSKPKAKVEDKVVDMFNRCVDEVKPLAILLSDYDKGICTERTIEVVLKFAHENKIKVVVDPSVAHMPYYKGAYIITPSAQEALAATGYDNVERAAREICKSLGAEHCIVTCGGDGMVWSKGGEKAQNLPALPAIVVDTCGAGDTVAAAFTFSAGAGMPMPTALRFAITAGALSVERGGAVPVPLYQIHRRTCAVYGTATKLTNVPHLSLLRLSAGVAEAKFGVTNGVFDMIHPGHISMLTQAAEHCDFLAVLVNSDESATRVKRKPLRTFHERAAALSALPAVDAIVRFDTDTPEELIKRLSPDILIKGPEWAGKEQQIPGAEYVLGTGGKVLATAAEFDTHTSDIIDRVSSAREATSETGSAEAGTDGAGDTPQ